MPDSNNSLIKVQNFTQCNVITLFSSIDELVPLVHVENELEAASIEAAAAPPNPPYMLLPTTTKFSLVALQSRSPETASCDPTRRHLYLSDADFKKVFRMSAIDFGKLAGWMQIEKKKMLHLF